MNLLSDTFQCKNYCKTWSLSIKISSLIQKDAITIGMVALSRYQAAFCLVDQLLSRHYLRNLQILSCVLRSTVFCRATLTICWVTLTIVQALSGQPPDTILRPSKYSVLSSNYNYLLSNYNYCPSTIWATSRYYLASFTEQRPLLSTHIAATHSTLKTDTTNMLITDTITFLLFNNSVRFYVNCQYNAWFMRGDKVIPQGKSWKLFHIVPLHHLDWQLDPNPGTFPRGRWWWSVLVPSKTTGWPGPRNLPSFRRTSGQDVTGRHPWLASAMLCHPRHPRWPVPRNSAPAIWLSLARKVGRVRCPSMTLLPLAFPA